MEGYAECKACNGGVLVPFHGPEGHVVYFCNNCLSRFSAYYEEPMFEGLPLFTSLAYYITDEDLEEEESLTSGELMEDFKRILTEIPPDPVSTDEGGAPYCAGPIGPDGKCADLCYLPEV